MPAPVVLPNSEEDSASPAEAGFLPSWARAGTGALGRDDPQLAALIEDEHRRQDESLMLVAAASPAPLSVLACEGTALSNVTTEGYPGRRFHAGCEIVDRIERLAVERVRAAFGARYANVQPHSGSLANHVLLFRLLEPGDTLLGMGLAQGGHLTHGSKPSVTGRYFRAVSYGVDASGRIDEDEVAALARRHRPRLVFCGASAYSRQIDFGRFRDIADEVGAFLVADISHVAGLVACGRHPSPIDQAHFTTTSTYKQLWGPRGGLIMMGRDADAAAPRGPGTLADLVERAVFPYFQGTPDLGAVAAKAHAFELVRSPDFRGWTGRILECARALARHFQDAGYDLVGGGTDNHTVLLDLRSRGLTGVVAERALESCGLIVNRNLVPGDETPARVTSGLRLGTNTVAFRGLGAPEMAECASLIRRVLEGLRTLGEQDFTLDEALRAGVEDEVRDLCRRFPLPEYPRPAPRGAAVGRRPGRE